MEFGYFTLSDNHYENNTRDANTFVTDITNEALYADQLGMHSAWIGEHHFNSLGVLSCPDLVLAYIAARTKHIRLAPAVTVTPLHHPDPRRRAMGDARSAVRRPRRFRRRPRLRQPRIRAVPCRLRRQPEHLRGRHGGDPEALGREGPHLAPRQALPVRRRAHHAEADPESAAGLYRLVLQALDRTGRPPRLRPDRRAVRRRHELRRARSRWPTSTTRPASSTARSPAA